MCREVNLFYRAKALSIDLELGRFMTIDGEFSLIVVSENSLG